MLLNFGRGDSVLNGERFRADEVPYNLVHLISGVERSICLKAEEDSLLYAQSSGHNGWLWIARNLPGESRDALVRELAELLRGAAPPGVTGEPGTAELFAQAYSRINGLKYETRMTMEAYACPKVRPPANVPGTAVAASAGHAEAVARFLAGFSEDAYGIAADPSSQTQAANGLIAAGGLWLWIVDGEPEPVSMANIAQRSPRHARINAVYTPSAARKRGYASALVAVLCERLEAEGIVPMLYADTANPDSNKVYRNIGFETAGTIADIKFIS